MFNTDDYKPGTGGGSKILQPEKHFCRIIDINLVPPSYKPEAYNIAILLEGPDMGDEFEGIQIDKDDASLGNYRGMIATVNSGRYPFSEFEWRGKTIERDTQIFNWINGLASQMGVFEGLKIQAETIEEYVEEIKKVLINPDLWGTFVIAGREYYKEGNEYPNYNLFFPKKKNNKYPFVKDDDEKNLIEFKEDEHIIKVEKPTDSPAVDSFGGQEDDGLSTSGESPKF